MLWISADESLDNLNQRVMRIVVGGHLLQAYDETPVQVRTR